MIDRVIVRACEHLESVFHVINSIEISGTFLIFNPIAIHSKESG